MEKTLPIHDKELREQLAQKILDSYERQPWDVTNLWGRALEHAANVVRGSHAL